MRPSATSKPRGTCIARTNSDVPKHHGISYFICPMDTPGIEIRPIVEMTGVHLFNEVFFDDARIPAENLVGEENRGWELAKVTLGAFRDLGPHPQTRVTASIGVGF